jgi:hypothetical protein
MAGVIQYFQQNLDPNSKLSRNDDIVEYFAEEFFNKNVRLSVVKEYFQKQELKRKRRLGCQLEIVFLFFFIPFCIMWQSFFGQTTSALSIMATTPFPVTPYSNPTAGTGGGEDDLPEAPSLSTFTDGFSNEDEFWQWVNNIIFGETFLKGVCGLQLGDGGNLPYSNSSTQILPPITAGLIRIRQVRVESSPCPSSASKMNITCYPEFNVDNEATRPIAARFNKNVSAYFYQTPATTTEGNYWGEYAFYPGGGYVLNLTTGLPPGQICDSNNLTTSLQQQINELRRARLVPFIDQATRAIIITLTTFSPDTGALVTTRLVTEISFSGSYQNSIQNLGAIFYRSNNSQLTMQIVSIFLGAIECIFAISSLWGAFFGWKIESNTWFTLDLTSSALMGYQMYVMFSLFFEQSFQSNFIQQINAENPDFAGSGFYSGTDLSTLASLNDINSCILLLSCFRLFRYSQYFEFMDAIHHTIKRTWKDILLYFTLLVLLSLGYVLCGMVVLSGSIASYKSYPEAVYTIMQYFILNIDYYSISNMKPLGIYFAPIFLVSFIFIFTWYMVAVFIAVIYVGYRTERTIIQRKLIRKREWEKKAIEFGAKHGSTIDIRQYVTNTLDKQQELVVFKRSFYYHWRNVGENVKEWLRQLVGLPERDGFKELYVIIDHLERYEERVKQDLASSPAKLFFVSFFDLIDIVKDNPYRGDDEGDTLTVGGAEAKASTASRSIQRAITRREEEGQASADDLRGDSYLDKMHPIEIQLSRVLRQLWTIPDDKVDLFTKFENDDVTQKVKRSLLVRIQESMQVLEQRESEAARVISTKLQSLQAIQEAMERDMRALRDLLK